MKSSASAATVKSPPAKKPVPADVSQEAQAASPSGKQKPSGGKPAAKPSKRVLLPIDDTRRVDWIALFVTDIATIANDEKGRCEVEVEWNDESEKSQASGLERGYGKTMAQAFREAVDKGLRRCGW